MQLADTNIILRYILNDNQELAGLARQIIETGAVEAKTEVIAEAVYVLKGVYGATPVEISAALTVFIEYSGILVEDKAMLVKALELFGSQNLGFVDCILAACAATNDARIHTFDKKLKKLIAQEPGI